MSTADSTPVQGKLFPEDDQQVDLLSGYEQYAHLAHAPVVAVEDFHDEKLPWAQQGEGLF